MISADSAVWTALDKIGERYGMSGNTLLAAAATELARVRPENLWHALGRIAEGEADTLPPPATATVSRRRIQKPIKPAITV